MSLLISLKKLFKSQPPDSKTDERTSLSLENEKKSLKEWPAANILLSISLISTLLFSCFAGYWGLTSVELKEVFKIFPQSLLFFLFSFLLPTNWLLFVWLGFLLLAFQLNLVNYSEASFGYFLALPFCIIILRNTKWFFWALIPFVIHAIGLLYLFVHYKIFAAEQFNVLHFLNAASSLSRDSFLAEMAFIYPLAFLSKQLNKFIDIFRYLE